MRDRRRSDHKDYKPTADASVALKIVAPKVGGAKFADGSMLTANGQLAGTPSVPFPLLGTLNLVLQLELTEQEKKDLVAFMRML